MSDMVRYVEMMRNSRLVLKAINAEPAEQMMMMMMVVVSWAARSSFEGWLVVGYRSMVSEASEIPDSKGQYYGHNLCSCCGSHLLAERAPVAGRITDCYFCVVGDRYKVLDFVSHLHLRRTLRERFRFSS